MKTLKYSILISLVSVFSSCDNFLDRIPLNSVTEDIFFKTENDIKLFADGLYSSFTPNASTVSFDFCSDLVGQNMSKSGTRDRNDLINGMLTSNSSTASYYWDYAPIRNSYILLEKIDQVSMPEGSKKLYVGTAQFSLAYRYFMMFRAYEGVPIVREVLKVENSDIGSSPKEEVFNESLSLIDKSIDNLPSIAMASRERGRLSKLVALTLKADLLLYTASRYKGSIEGATFETATLAARAALDEANKQGYGLADNYKKMFVSAFQAEADAQKEIIFEKVQLEDIATSNTLQMAFGPRMSQAEVYSDFASSQEMIDMYECTDGLPITKSTLYDPLRPFNDRDPRLKLSTLYPGNECSFADGETWLSNTLDPSADNKDYMLSDYNVIDRAPSGYINIKYWDGLRWGEPGFASFIVYRYAELLLMYAEALNESAGPSADVYAVLTQLRARTSVNMPAITAKNYASKESLRALIRNERAVELFGEGKRYWDVRRWGIGEQVQNKEFYSMHIARYNPDGSVAEYMDKIYARTDLEDPSKEALFEIPSGKDGGLFMHLGVFNDPKYYVWPIPQGAIDKSNSGVLKQHALWK